MSAENKIFITPEGEHDYNKKYKQYTFVTYTKDGTKKVYMSIKNVPQFISILDTNYWKFVKSDVGGEEVDITGKADKVDTPNVIHLDNYEHRFDTLTDAQVAGLRVGDIIEVSDVTEHFRWIYFTYNRDNDDVVHLMLIQNSTTEIFVFFKLVKLDDYWELEEEGSMRENTPVYSGLPLSGGILPNVLYKLGTLADNSSNTIRLATPTNTNIANIYHITFNTGDFDGTQESRGPSIMWGLPITTRWVGGSAPAIEPNKYYEVTIMDNIANYVSVSKTITL